MLRFRKYLEERDYGKVDRKNALTTFADVVPDGSYREHPNGIQFLSKHKAIIGWWENDSKKFWLTGKL